MCVCVCAHASEYQTSAHGTESGKREGKMKTRRRRPRQVIQKALVRHGVRVREC